MTLEKQIELGEKAIILIDMNLPLEIVNRKALPYLVEVNKDCKNGIGYDTRLYNSFIEKYQEYKSRIKEKKEDNYSQEDVQEQLNNVGALK